MPLSALLVGESGGGEVRVEPCAGMGYQQRGVKLLQVGQQVDGVGCQTSGFYREKRQINRDGAAQDA